jgi:hypothetical protein
MMRGKGSQLCRTDVLASQRQKTHAQERKSLLPGRVPVKKLWLVSAAVVKTRSYLHIDTLSRHVSVPLPIRTNVRQKASSPCRLFFPTAQKCESISFRSFHESIAPFVHLTKPKATYI